ncbi:hypothetical protein BV25DRAFT_1833358 [Artomyces pyxidatus]|uniref:Uncharacterized protein n=1 Tax=Artomyces pyxidatus TaxID=48021 RepID=A0ACB8SH23_9AGAM|nr:hypothetical protein BV25DRAFT_1833358 [Artomyces pyxidatus]
MASTSTPTISPTDTPTEHSSSPPASPTTVLFLPSSGAKYTKEDRVRCLAQQPLPSLPMYLRARRSARFSPPILHYGWIIDTEQLLRFAIKYCPDEVEYISDSPTSQKYPSRSSTVTNPDLFPAVCKALGIPYQPHVQVKFFTNEQGRTALGLAVGNNYDGVIEELHRRILSNAFAHGTAGQWFLDLENWQWTPNHDRAAKKSKELSPPSGSS